jgi:metallo-beta-lactamase family protein
MKYTPYGAVGQVTGSRHLIEVGQTKVLLDCGLFQGEHDLAPALNRVLPFAVNDLTAVILSHGHIDHSGCLPLLIKQGFKGKIYASRATRDVVELMLYDTSKIQRQDYEYRLRHDPVGAAAHVPTYDDNDVAETLAQFESVEYGECRKLSADLEFCLYNAGHILGSSVIHLTINEAGQSQTLAYTGDLGKQNMPILKVPDILPPTDTLICETTYGDRLHENLDEAEETIVKLIKEAYANKSKIFVPAFALGRMQTLIYTLHRLSDAGIIPNIPIYVDSPLATDLTAVFAKHPECFDEETQKLFIDKREQPFRFSNLRYVSSVEDSKRLNNTPGPLVILASSGMMEGGRILHHLINGLSNPHNVILIVGYMARRTLGRQILEGARQVRIFHHVVPVRAQVHKINAYSAHADRAELTSYIKATPNLQRLLLVHGDEDSRHAFAEYIKGELPDLNVQEPAYGQSLQI